MDREGGELGAGDQGLMFGYACDETPELMPLPISLAHALMRRQAALRRSGDFPWLRPDAKSQVTVRYIDRVPVGVEKVVLSTQHSEDIDTPTLREEVRRHIIEPVIPERLRSGPFEVLVNPTGRFTVGGPKADAGLTGLKIIVDTYGRVCPHVGGAFSGKDPSRVDRSAAYMARCIAKNLMAAGCTRRCLVQLACAIGTVEPVSFLVGTQETGTVPDEELEHMVRDVVPLTPRGITEALDLRRPISGPTAAYGHVDWADPSRAWESNEIQSRQFPRRVLCASPSVKSGFRHAVSVAAAAERSWSSVRAWPVATSRRCSHVGDVVLGHSASNACACLEFRPSRGHASPKQIPQRNDARASRCPAGIAHWLVTRVRLEDFY